MNHAFKCQPLPSWSYRAFWQVLCLAGTPPRRPSIWLLLIIVTSITSCAVVYDDANGTKHIIGLAKVEIRPPADDRSIAGDVVDVTIIGVGVYNTEVHGGLVLGYSREVSAAIRDNVLVIGNPMQAIQAPAPNQTVGRISSGKNKR
jgi:hypothetical protein